MDQVNIKFYALDDILFVDSKKGEKLIKQDF